MQATRALEEAVAARRSGTGIAADSIPQPTPSPRHRPEDTRTGPPWSRSARMPRAARAHVAIDQEYSRSQSTRSAGSMPGRQVRADTTQPPQEKTH